MFANKPSASDFVAQRRAFIKDGVLALSAICSTASTARFADAQVAAPQTGSASAEFESVVRVGMMTDMHHADKNAAGNRYYRETLGKLD